MRRTWAAPHGWDPKGPLTTFDYEVVRSDEGGRPRVVVVTELAANQGLSVTNNAERVVRAVRDLLAGDVTVVEHYDEGSYVGGRELPETFDLVEVSDGVAFWRHLGGSLTEALGALEGTRL